MFTWHPHFPRRNVENMGLHHVHPQEAPTNGENGFGTYLEIYLFVFLSHVSIFLTLVLIWQLHFKSALEECSTGSELGYLFVSPVLKSCPHKCMLWFKQIDVNVIWTWCTCWCTNRNVCVASTCHLGSITLLSDLLLCNSAENCKKCLKLKAYKVPHMI